MNFREYVETLKMSWAAVAICGVLGALVGGLAFAYTPSSFESNARIFITVVAPDDADATTLAAGTAYARQLVASYVEIASSPRILDDVIDDLSRNTSSAELANHIEVYSPLSAGTSTALIAITAEDSEAVAAAKIANSLASNLLSAIIEDASEPNAAAPGIVTVQIIEPGVTPSAPSGGGLPLFLLLGVLFGISGGFALAFGARRLNRKIHSTSVLRLVTSLPIIGGILYEAQSDEQLHSIELDKSTHANLPIEEFCTHLTLFRSSRKSLSVLIAGTAPGARTATTALDVARELARRGSSVAVVDGNLRDSEIAHLLDLELRPGLLDLLDERTTYEQVLIPYGPDGLFVLTSGSPDPHDSATALTGSGTTRLMKSLARDFDFVIVVAPPVIQSTDAVALSSIVDTSLLQVTLGATKLAQVDAALRAFEEFGQRFQGLVLTDVRSPTPHSERRTALGKSHKLHGKRPENDLAGR